MPLMRIRSVEIVFEDEISACTDTGILDRSIELIVSDSDDSTKCVDDLEHLQVERDDNDSVTLNAEADLSDDISVSLNKDVIEELPKVETPQLSFHEVDDASHAPSVTSVKDANESVNDDANESVNDDVNESMVDVNESVNDDATLSLNLSDVVDSGRFTEDASSSHFESIPILAYEDALLSQSLDVIDKSTVSAYDISEVCSISTESQPKLLYEYIDSDSDSSDNTAVCEDPPMKHLLFQNIPVSVDPNVCDSNDLQYDSFIDMGKF